MDRGKPIAGRGCLLNRRHRYSLHLGLGHLIVPYALVDLASNDLILSVQQILFETYGERFTLRPISKQKVNTNHLGRKTGRGWYNYNKYSRGESIIGVAKNAITQSL